MLTKIYLILLAIFTLLSFSFAYYSWSWLQSISNPETAVASFGIWSGYFWISLFSSSLILLILANIILWSKRSSWALWATLVYFAAFILLKFLWINEVYLNFKQDKNLPPDGFTFASLFDSLGIVIGILICAVAAVVVFFNHYFVVRLNEKMYPTEELNADLNVAEQPVIPD